jgi:hypothetical protein
VDLNALVERYFGSADRITDAGGDINETSGDRFMAIFQTAIVRRARCARAAAALILALTEALNQRDDNPLAIHIGINSPGPLGSTRFEDAAAPAGLSPRAAWSPPGRRLAARRATARSWRVRTGAAPGGRYRLERVGHERLGQHHGAIEVHRISPPSKSLFRQLRAGAEDAHPYRDGASGPPRPGGGGRAGRRRDPALHEWLRSLIRTWRTGSCRGW